MQNDIEARYAARLNRYVTAMRNGKPDCVPIRPFVAEFTAKYAGYTCQEVTHDFQKAFAAARKCAADFDWDAVVGNMVYVWTGLVHAIGLKYYRVPGVGLSADTGFQYLEPAENDAFMRDDEYDELIDDPVRFLFNKWLPRASNDVAAPGEPASYRNNLSFLKGGMAMLNYFSGFPAQGELLRKESGTVSAISGILKAPLDILADKLRGYLGLTMDLLHQPAKVQAACEALAPHLLHVALSGADPDKKIPIGFWMHRGCVPFIKQEHFDKIFWPTLKPIILELWARGHQTLFYAEGKWGAHFDTFADLPDGSIVFHVDRDDIRETHKILGGKFCLSGGIPNYLLSMGSPDEVRDCCKKVIDDVAGDGGYILDASAIIQNDARVENVRAMTETARTHGVYGSAPACVPESPDGSKIRTEPMRELRVKPGVCIPWEEKLKELPEIVGDASLVRRVWEENDSLAYVYIWHCLLSF
jgi:hypothetical protein